jgi:Heme/copper-type cytochrome/quinol oxidases, subunit 2
MTDHASRSPDAEAIASQFELGWGVLVGVIIALLLGMIVFTAVHWSSMPPSRVEVVEASTLHRTGEFVQDNLGTAVDATGRIVVRMLAAQYAFRPSCVVVPEGVPVTFRATSSDVVHGFQILGTNVNSMVVPGYVSTFEMTLHGVGERAMPCHEFCGVGHASMWARVRVLPWSKFQALSRAKRRTSCV